MIEQVTAEEGVRVLGAAIWQLLQDAKANASDFPRNGFQQRMRFAGLTEAQTCAARVGRSPSTPHPDRGLASWRIG